MSHFGVIAPPLHSHVKAFEALAVRLIERGHRVTFFQQGEAQALLDDSRIGFYAIGQQSHGEGALAKLNATLAYPAGFGLIGTIRALATTTDMLCRTLPAALDAQQVDGLLVDQMEPAGGLIAEALALPFVSVACALPINREPGVPLPVMPFAYADDAQSLKKYAISERIHDRLMAAQERVIARWAQAFGLPARAHAHACLSPLAQISQTIPAFDFPRRALPTHFHAVGPLRLPAAPIVKAMTPPLPEQPFVFASLGTLQGHRVRLFAKIARACRRLDTPLLVAHCHRLSPAQAARLEAIGATTVVGSVDQPRVLRQAQAVVTHAGLNTVVDAIESATPMLALPLAFDQPGVAGRVAHHGLGRRASRFASHRALAAHLERLFADPGYRQRLARMQVALTQAGGAERAANIVERALGQNRPVEQEAA